MVLLAVSGWGRRPHDLDSGLKRQALSSGLAPNLPLAGKRVLQPLLERACLLPMRKGSSPPRLLIVQVVYDFVHGDQDDFPGD